MCTQFTSKQHKKYAALCPDLVQFLNSNSLQVIDNMFFRLPFPDIQRMEKVHERAGIQQDVTTFLTDMQSDLGQGRAMSDFCKGWVTYIKQHLTTDASGTRQDAPPVNPYRMSSAKRREGSSTPTPSDDENDNCCWSASRSSVVCSPLLHICICIVSW
jgi:hypothetical protein